MTADQLAERLNTDRATIDRGLVPLNREGHKRPAQSYGVMLTPIGCKQYDRAYVLTGWGWTALLGRLADHVASHGI